MRHRVKGRKLGRTASHRSATLRALATSLLKHKKIKTTVAKAKETRSFVEPLITKAKADTLHARRFVSQFIKDKEVLKELFSEIIPKIGDRPGGYTRVVKLGTRVGDAADMAIIELVDYNVIAEKKEKKTTAGKTRKTTKAADKKPVVEDAEVIEEVVEPKKEKTEAKKEKKSTAAKGSAKTKKTESSKSTKSKKDKE
ncbi:MAG: 50S ribosomal protein L17 [Melioribacteraceae bacterium]|nr:50S ribosomal protein L17 [Melioribacteraceae bacterium]